MPTNDAELRIGGNIDDLKAATDKAAAEVKRMSDQMQSSLGSLNGAFQKIHGSFMAFTAVLAGGAAFKGVINASNDWALESGKLAKALGTTTEQASVMKVALNHVGVESDVMVAASQKMSKQIFSNGEAFEKMGIKVKDSSGEYRPVLKIMEETNAKLIEIQNPIEQNIAGMQVYGKSWTEIKGILKLTGEQMKWAEQRAKELHLIVGPEGEAQAKQYKAQMRDLNMVGKSLEVQFGQQLTPVFVRLGKWMGEEAPAMGGVFATILESIAFGAMATWLALKDMGDGLGAMAAQAAALLHGDLEGFRAIGRMRDEEAAKNEAAYERMKANFGKPLPVAKSAEPSRDGPTYDFKGDSGGGATAEKSKMATYEAALAEMKVAFQRENDLRQMSKQQELDYWTGIQGAVASGSKDAISIKKKIAETELEILKQTKSTRDGLRREEIDEAEKQSLNEIAMKVQAAEQERALGKINNAQLLDQKRIFEAESYQIELDAAQRRLELMREDPDKNPVALQKLEDQKMVIYRKHLMQRSQIDKEFMLEQSKGIMEINKVMENSMVTLMTKAITDWKKFGQVLNGVFKGIFQVFLHEMIVKPLAEMAMRIVKETALYKSLSAFKLGVMATESAAETAGKTAEIATNFAAAESAAGLTAVNSMASVAAIPFYGWAMAPEVGAANYAVAQGFAVAASASGGFDIPTGVNPVTQLHQEEMVLPAHIANPLRDSLASGVGNDGGGVSVNITAMDARSVRDYFKQNSHSLGPALRRMARNMTPVRG